MRLASGYAQAMLAVVRRDLSVFMSYRLRWMSRIASTLLTLTVFFYVSKLARPNAVGHHTSYFAFLIVGILAVPVLESVLNLATSLRSEIIAGNFERTVVSPLGPLLVILSMAIFPVVYAITLSALTLGLGVLLYGVAIHAAGIPAALLAVLLGAASFTGLGLLFVAAFIAFKSSAGVAWFAAGLGLVGGVYFPLALLPGWARWLSEVQPLSPAVDLTRHFLVSTPAVHPVWSEFVKLVGFAVIVLPASCEVLWLALKVSRRRGTILEY